MSLEGSLTLVRLKEGLGISNLYGTGALTFSSYQTISLHHHSLKHDNLRQG